MKFRLDGLVLVLMSLFPAMNPAQTDPEEAPLTPEFLEFLADWETDQGEWAGPEQFEDDSFEQLFEDAENAEQDIAEDIGEVENAE